MRGATDWGRFADKVRLAVESSRAEDPDGGASGLEVEVNVLGPDLHPVERVGYGPESRCFSDLLHDGRLAEVARWGRLVAGWQDWRGLQGLARSRLRFRRPGPSRSRRGW